MKKLIDEKHQLSTQDPWSALLPSPLRILHIIASVDRAEGGPIEGIIQAAAHGPAGRHLVHVACLDSPAALCAKTCPVTTFALGPEWDEYRKNRLFPWRHYKYSQRLVPWLKANIRHYDVVVVNGLWNYSTMAARLALVGSTVPYVVFTHGMLDPWFRKRYPLKNKLKQVSWWFCEGPLLNNADAVLFTTEDERQVSRNAFSPYRPVERVVGFGTGGVPLAAPEQLDAFRAAVPTLSGNRFLLFLGRIHEKKGCDILIEGFAYAVSGGYCDRHLVIAGPDQQGLRSFLEANAERLGVADRIHWPGMLTGDAKWGALRSAEALVLPSHQENFGVVVAEALACGRPVLISDKVNIWREVSQAGAGLVEPDSLAGVERLIRRFLKLPETERTAMARAARKCFLEKYEARIYLDNLNKIFIDAIDGTRPRNLSK